MATSRVVAVILGGGQGSRLYPLTKDRAKPAVPIGGKYRLIDIPISNCLNSRVKAIYLLTQFLSASLHRHIQNTYKFDVFSRGFVYVLAAQQTARGMDWYQGTADAVRKQLDRFGRNDPEDILILSGDHLYRMNYSPFLKHHRETRADVTIAVQPVAREAAPRFGILKTSADGIIDTFCEKPRVDQLDGLESLPGTDQPYLASMGIYVFRHHVLRDLLLGSEAEDFGRQIIPAAIEELRVAAYTFDGYWEDIGTIRSFYEANLSLTDLDPEFSFYDPDHRIYTRPRFLPSTRADGCELVRTMIADGCLIHGSSIRHAVIGQRSVIGNDSRIRDTVMMGADIYETEEDRAENRRLGRPDVGIGERCSIEGTILDMNARIGDDVAIRRRTEDAPDEETENYSVRDGIVAIPKNAVIPDGSLI